MDKPIKDVGAGNANKRLPPHHCNPLFILKQIFFSFFFLGREQMFFLE